jgi:hypothetical protein
MVLIFLNSINGVHGLNGERQYVSTQAEAAAV